MREASSKRVCQSVSLSVCLSVSQSHFLYKYVKCKKILGEKYTQSQRERFLHFVRRNDDVSENSGHRLRTRNFNFQLSTFFTSNHVSLLALLSLAVMFKIGVYRIESYKELRCYHTMYVGITVLKDIRKFMDRCGKFYTMLSESKKGWHCPLSSQQRCLTRQGRPVE